MVRQVRQSQHFWFRRVGVAPSRGGTGASLRFILIQFNVPFKIISAHMKRANQ